MKRSKWFIKVKNGNVTAVNEANNTMRTYYRKGDAQRAYFSDMGDGYVEIYLNNGTILIVNDAGNLIRTMK